MQQKNQNSLKLRSELANAIKRAREKTGKSCNKIEEEFEIGRGVLNRIENSKFDCKFITLWKICEAIDIKVADLITEIESNLGDTFHIVDK